MLKYAVLILWRKKGIAANFYAFCISGNMMMPDDLSENVFKFTFGGGGMRSKLEFHHSSKIASHLPPKIL